MPTITYSKRDLKKLVKKKISDEQLEEVINLIKPSVEKVGQDEITIEHTADRPDLFGVEGLARAVNKYLGINVGLEKYSFKKSGITISVENVPVRPFIAAAVVRKVKLDEEFLKNLINTQEVLHETIGRKRKKVAIGIHDLEKISPPINYNGMSRGTRIIPLDYKSEMTLKEVLEKTEKGKIYGDILIGSRLWPVFVDSKGVFSFPPILNSERTRLTEKTKNLLVEVTGVDKETVNQTLNILVTNFVERNFEIQSVDLKYKMKGETTPEMNEMVVELNKNAINKNLGVDLNTDEMINLLRRMGYDSVDVGEKLEVIVPPYRVDILHPVDVIEDIAIAYGYNNFIPKLPNVATIGKPHELERIGERARQILIGFGFQEVMTSVLSNAADQIEKMNWHKLKKDLIDIENPVSEEYTCMRLRIKPSLLKVLTANKHVEYPQNIFEIGDVVWKDSKAETLSKNVRSLAAVICHSKAGFAEIKSVAESLLKNLGVDYKLENYDFEEMIPGRSVKIVVDGKYVGGFGEIHPQILENWDLNMPIAALELHLEFI